MNIKGDKKIVELHHVIVNWEFNYMHLFNKKISVEFQSSIWLKKQKPYSKPETESMVLL